MWKFIEYAEGRWTALFDLVCTVNFPRNSRKRFSPKLNQPSITIKLELKSLLCILMTFANIERVMKQRKIYIKKNITVMKLMHMNNDRIEWKKWKKKN
jgi:hypothetical protein